MEMDINTDWVSAFTYVHAEPRRYPATRSMGVKLLDNMSHDGSQYLQPSSRDFFAFTADAKVLAPTPTTTTTTTATDDRQEEVAALAGYRGSSSRLAGVHAVALAGGAGAVVEHVAEVAAAAPADDLRRAPCRGCGR